MTKVKLKDAEYENFRGALKKVLRVSPAEMRTKLEAEKREKPPTKKTK